MDTIRRILKEEEKNWRLKAITEKIRALFDDWLEARVVAFSHTDKLGHIFESGFPQEMIKTVFEEKKEAIVNKIKPLLSNEVRTEGFTDNIWKWGDVPYQAWPAVKIAIARYAEEVEELNEVNLTNWKNLKFRRLKVIKGDLTIEDCPGTEFPALEKVGENICIFRDDIEEFPKLEHVGGKLEFFGWARNLWNMPLLETVGKSIDICKSPITSLPKLRRVGGNANFTHCESLQSLPALEYVKHNLFLECTEIDGPDQLPKNLFVGDSMFFGWYNKVVIKRN